jgi:hypothetical protein
MLRLFPSNILFRTTGGCLVAALIAIVPAASATVHHVPGDFATIQAAIDAAASGDTVKISCGTYYECDLLLKGGITLRSDTGLPDCVAIVQPDPFACDDILVFSSAETSVIEGIEFADGSSDNSGGAIDANGPLVITRCSFSSNAAMMGSGGAVYANGEVSFVDCSFISNRAAFNAGAVYASGGPVTFLRCTFVGNRAVDGNGGAVVGSVRSFYDCAFTANGSTFDGGALDCDVDSIVGCLFVNNWNDNDPGWTAVGGAARLYGSGSPFISQSTFYGNDAGGLNVHGSAIGLVGSGHGTIDRCVIVNNYSAEAVYCGPNASLTVECSDIWGNLDGDWTGCIASQSGQDGNISVDPGFCDPIGENFRLRSTSLCLDADCGRMGAFGIGCFDDNPAIRTIRDVKNDQGKQVSIAWWRSGRDAAGSMTPILQYAVYRLMDPDLSPPQKTPDGAVVEVAPDRLDNAFPPGTWHFLMTVPARADSQYAVVAPTLKDSTVVAGMYQSVFFVSALTASPTVYFDSPLDSGHSVDNLEPSVPSGFVVAYNTGSGNQLVWAPAGDTDFQYFRVYRGASSGFEPSALNLVKMTTVNAWTDPEYDGWGVHYKVSAVDFSGNESAAASPSQSPTSARGNLLPNAFALLPNVPNPFNPSTVIPFNVPRGGGIVTMDVYDVVGRRVRMLRNGVAAEGRHEVSWDGRNDRGQRVASGVYLVRMRANSVEQVRKVVLAK